MSSGGRSGDIGRGTEGEVMIVLASTCRSSTSCGRRTAQSWSGRLKLRLEGGTRRPTCRADADYDALRFEGLIGWVGEKWGFNCSSTHFTLCTAPRTLSPQSNFTGRAKHPWPCTMHPTPRALHLEGYAAEAQSKQAAAYTPNIRLLCPAMRVLSP